MNNLLIFSSILLIFINLTIAITVPPPTEDGPLILTDLIERGEIEKARSLSRINNLPGSPSDLEQYSGYLTVNKKYGGNTFFWFFVSPNETAPVCLWLQGGPGSSSLFALFTEHGPIQVNDKGDLESRKYTWNNLCSMLYIDNPVGTGFSFVNDARGFARNEDDVGRDLLNALIQFFKVFHDYKSKPFYVTGESYAGKYVPAIGHYLHVNLVSSGIRFEGVAIGNGLSDPPVMLKYADYLYNIGLFDRKARDIGYDYERRASEAMKAGKNAECFNIFDEYLNGDIYPYKTFLTNSTGFTFYFNYLIQSEPSEYSSWTSYLNREDVKKAIHVGSMNYSSGNNTVEKYLRDDLCRSVKNWVEELANNQYKVMIYSGQLDIIVHHLGTREMINTMKWSGLKKFTSSQQRILTFDGEKNVLGYVKQADKFSFVLIRNAGHMVPHDQPKAAYQVLDRFLNDRL